MEQEKALAEAGVLKEALAVMREGKGVLTLETPIKSGDTEIGELPYDFTVLTGMEYTDAMDADRMGSAQNLFAISHRQALQLFAAAAAKQVERLDATDIVTRIGMTDAVEAVQLAVLFFRASTQAGRRRISKRSSTSA